MTISKPQEVWVLYANGNELATDWILGVFETRGAAQQHWYDTHPEAENQHWEWRPNDGGFWATGDDNYIVEGFCVQTHAQVLARRGKAVDPEAKP